MDILQLSSQLKMHVHCFLKNTSLSNLYNCRTACKKMLDHIDDLIEEHSDND